MDEKDITSSPAPDTGAEPAIYTATDVAELKAMHADARKELEALKRAFLVAAMPDPAPAEEAPEPAPSWGDAFEAALVKKLGMGVK